MKSPAFQWYAADYLADERVMLLSLESEAAYVRLLNYCWREGSIPSNPALCAPMCKYADAKVIKPALALFTKSPTQTGRLIHKRLEEERAKQEAFRARQSEKGAKGGRPRKEEEKPEKPAALPGLNRGLTGEKPEQSPRMPSSLSSTSSSMSSNDDNAGESSSPKPELSDDLKARLAALTDTSGEVRWNESLLTKPTYFAKVAGKLVAADVDLEHYRRAALIVAEADNTHRTIKGWESWVANYLTNQLQRGPLLTLTAAALDLSKPTPREELPVAGSDCTGRHIVLARTGDANMDRMQVAAYANHFPNATFHTTR